MRRRTSAFRRGSGFSPAWKISTISIAIVTAALIVRSRPQPPPISREERVVVATFDTVQVPVPSDPVAAGTRLKDVRWKMVDYPRHQLPAGALQETSSVMDSIAAVPLPAELPVFRQNIAAGPSSINRVVERIPAGMRAMTIKVDATTAVEGWAGSGSLVDVLLIAKERTTVVAEKVRILSAERSTDPIEGARPPSVPSTITLLVSQDQCLAINTAIPLGRIAFALRSSNDEEQWVDTVFTSDELKNNPAIEDKNGAIKGYVTVNDKVSKAFALTDGKWIPAETRPVGFLVNGDKP